MSRPIQRSSTGLSFLSRSRTSLENDIVSHPSSSGSSCPKFRRISGSRVASTTVPSSPSSSFAKSANNSPITPAPTFPYFTRRSKTSKAQRRQSTPAHSPALRTQPYDYPYFAAPPVVILPDDTGRSRSTSSADAERTPRQSDQRTSELVRGREHKQVNTQAQASLGHGRPVPKQRSASESWVTRGGRGVGLGEGEASSLLR